MKRPRLCNPCGTKALLVSLLFVPFLAFGLPSNSGDIDGNDTRNISDVSCFATATLASLENNPAPDCQEGPLASVDMQCNGGLDVTDVQRSILVTLYGLTGDAEIEGLLQKKDADLDLVHDDCDPDDDNDTFPDLCEIDNGTLPLDASSVPTAINPCTCPDACDIDGECYPEGASNPDNPCMVCNTIDAPTSWSAASGSSCNDGDLCTTDDVCAAGTCIGGPPAVCGAGGQCDASTCIPSVGCILTPLDGLGCDDNDACTETSTCQLGFCVGADPVTCDDGNACTVEACLSDTGCNFQTAPDASPCDDGDLCTSGDACLAGACESGATLPACLAPPNTVCQFTDAADTEVECSIHVERFSGATPPPAALQFSIAYDVTRLEPIEVVDEICIGNGTACFDASVPPANLYPSGHSLVLAPSDTGNWNGTANFISANPGSPTTPLSVAIVGATEGPEAGSEILRIRFKVLVDLEGNPGFVSVTDALAATAASVSLNATVSGQSIVLSGGACENEGNCNDGNLCTDESCSPISGLCEYTLNTVPCDDGNFCTGADVCSLGSCSSAPLTCDDEDACTADICLAGIGCSNSPVFLNCDDGNPCTSEGCDSTTGACAYSPEDGAPCADGDPCTNEDTCLNEACEPGPLNPECSVVLDSALCTFEGSPGDVVNCPVQLARWGFAGAAPVAMQIQLTLGTGNASEFVGLVDTVCITETLCVETSTPPANLYPSGHSVALSPENVADWNEEEKSGTLVISNPASPTTPLSLAYEEVPGGGIVGDSTVVTLQFLIHTELTSESPGVVLIDDSLSATASGVGMTHIIRNNTLIAKVDGCADTPSVCQDGVACKTASCSVGSSCCAARTDETGCDLPTCEAAICALDSFCCDDAWDEYCVSCAMGKSAFEGVDCSSVEAVCNLDCDISDTGTCIPTVNDSACDGAPVCSINTCDPLVGCVEDSSGCP